MSDDDDRELDELRERLQAARRRFRDDALALGCRQLRDAHPHAVTVVLNLEMYPSDANVTIADVLDGDGDPLVDRETLHRAHTTAWGRTLTAIGAVVGHVFDGNLGHYEGRITVDVTDGTWTYTTYDD